MRKKKDPLRSFGDRLCSVEAKIRQLTVENDRAITRFRKKFGDKTPAVHELQQRIRKKIESEMNFDDDEKGYSYKDGELKLWHIGQYSDEVIALFGELKALRGEPPDVLWRPGWQCVCGNHTSVWFRPRDHGSYNIYCEDCWEKIGSGTEDEMYEEVGRGLATDVISWPQRNELNMPHYMFQKRIAEGLGVKSQDLPRYIGMRGRTPEHYMESLKDLPRRIAERQAEDEDVRTNGESDSVVALRGGDVGEA